MKQLAERLGFAADDRVAIIHADDVGMCHAVNEGCFAAMETGSVTCGSVMVPCPWFPEAAERARRNPELDLGVHLTLNAEYETYRWGPAAGRRAVPSLLDDEGYLPRDVMDLVGRAKIEEVELELRTQIEMALEAGIDVTHLDSHMGTVMVPPLHEVYKKLSLEFGVPAFAASPSDAALEELDMAGYGPLLRGFAAEMDAAGYPVLDGFDALSLSFSPGEGAAHNERRLSLLPKGVSYLICHPSLPGEELNAIAPQQAHQREFEQAYYGGPAGREALERHGIQTVGMRELRELLRAESA